MSRGYRRLIASAVGCLILTANGNPADQRQGQNHHDPAAQAMAPNGQSKPSYFQYSCKQQRDVNEASVCASIRQTVAAEEANTLNAKGLWWNRIGIGAVIATLLATAWAAYEASSAARAARRATDIFVRGDRATLSPFNAGLAQQHGGRSVAVLSVANVGKSAAVVKRVSYSWGRSIDADAYQVFLGGTPRADLCPAGETVNLGMLTKRGDGEDFVAGYVEYRDPYAADHRSYFVFQLFDASAGVLYTERMGKGWPADT